jgi:hypothetical protein
MAQLDEPSVEAEKILSAGAIGGDNQVGNSSVVIASSAATAVDPLTDALAALDRRIMGPLSGFLRRAAGKTPRPLSRTHGRPSIARIMRLLSGFLRRSAGKMPLRRR